MEARFNYVKVAPGAFRAMLGLGQYLHECGLEESLINLMYLRASEINGCAYCLDMHWKDLRASGESEQRLYGLNAWARISVLYQSGACCARVDGSGNADHSWPRAG